MGPPIDLKIELNTFTKKMTFTCLNFPEKSVCTSNLPTFNPLSGVRFAVSITYEKEYFEVKSMKVIPL